MKRARTLIVLMLLLAGIEATAQVVPPQIAYIIPDIGAPGMNTYVEIVAPYDRFGKFGTADGLFPLSALQVRLVNQADSQRVIISPCVASWDGRLVSCQFFVKPGAAPGPIPIRIRAGTDQSNVDTFFIVQPQSFGSKTGGGVIGNGGAWGTRSKRGAMIVDSMVLSSGTYTFSTTDTDPYINGNQAYLPVIILSKGRVAINSGAILSVSAPGKNAGPGGGGGGGYGNSNTFIRGELDVPLGAGFTGGKSAVPLVGTTAGFGSGSGPGSNGLNGVETKTTSITVAPIPLPVPAIHAGPGHPFDNDSRSGGALSLNATTGAVLGVGGGGNATAGTGTGNTSIDGQIIGSSRLVPLHGGGGGASGGSCDSVGGGGGGAIALYSYGEAIAATVHARGADGRNGANAGTGTCSNTPPRGDASAGGAGGGIILGAKMGIQLTTLDVAGGSGGTRIGTTTAAGGNGGVGRFRNDGRLVGGPTVTTNASRFAGPTMDTLTYADSAFKWVRGTGRVGDSILVFVRGQNSDWNTNGAFGTTVGSDSTWSVRIRFPYDSLGYVFALQKTSATDLGGTTQYTRVPSHVFSQMAASIVRLNLIPKLVAPSSRTLDSVLCPGLRYDTIRVVNQGNAPLVLKPETGFTGTYANLYQIISPALPDTVDPEDSVQVIVAFNGLTTGNGARPAILRLITNDLTRTPWDVAYNVVKETRSIQLQPVHIDLGSVYVGTPRDTFATYRNNNSYQDRITGIAQLSGTGFSSFWPTSFPMTHEPGDTTMFGFRFVPKDTGRVTAVFKISTSPCDKDTFVTVVAYGRSAIIRAPKIVEFGGLACGDTATERLVIRNTGNAPMTLHYPSLDGTDRDSFSIVSPSLGTFPATIAIGDSIVFQIRVTAATPRPLAARLTFQSNDSLPRKNPYLVDLAASRDAAMLETVDTTIDFGAVCLGSDSTRDLRLRNISQFTAVAIERISRADSTAPFIFEVPVFLPLPISARDSASFPIRFSPRRAGRFNDTLLIRTSPCDRLLRVVLRGEGVGAEVQTDLTAISFGDVRVGSSARRTMIVTNGSPSWASPLQIARLILSPTDAQVKIIHPTIPPARSLAPGDTMQIVLEYTPGSSARLKPMQLGVIVAAPCLDTLYRPIDGNGIVSAVAASRTVLSLRSMACAGPESVEDTLTLFNFGSAPLDVTKLAPMASAPFELVSPAPPFTMPPGGSRSIRVRYVPGTASRTPSTDSLEVVTNDPQRPRFTIPLIGYRDTAAFSISAPRLDFPTSFVCSDPVSRTLTLRNTGTLHDTITASASAPFMISPAGPYILAPDSALVVTVLFAPAVDGVFTGRLALASQPCDRMDSVQLEGERVLLEYDLAAVDFGDVAVSSTSQAAARFTNTSPVAVRISSASIAPVSGDLAVVAGQFPMTIPAGATGDIMLSFTPAAAGGIPAGTRVIVVLDSVCADTIEAELLGQGIAGGVAVTRRSLDFGALAGCEQAFDTVVVRNIGSAPFRLLGVTITPSADYSLIDPPPANISLTPGDSVQIVVRFMPAGGIDGAHNGFLTLTTDDAQRPEVIVDLEGERVTQSMTIAGPVFNETVIGATDRQTRWLINTGTAPITISDLTISAPFRIVSTTPDLPRTLAPGDSLAALIEFAPVDPGVVADSLRIVADVRCDSLPPLAIDGRALGDGSAEVELAKIEASPGDRITVPLMLRSSLLLDKTGAHGFRTVVTFNRSLLLPTGSTPIGTIRGGNRSVTLIGIRPEGMTTGTLLELEFIAALGDSTSTPLRIESFEWIDGPVRTTTVDGEVKIKANGGWKLFVGNGTFTLEPGRPNPTNGRTEITYEVIEEGRAILYVTDLMGKRIATLVDDDIAPGRYAMIFDAAQLASGNYFLVLETPTGQLMRPLQVKE